ncbi:MAG: SUMF1/EgtB/PvdO family nonheme iron enzyme [Candidatus Tectimicrobiota bacterium]
MPDSSQHPRSAQATTGVNPGGSGTLNYAALQAAVVEITVDGNSLPGAGCVLKIDGQRAYILTAYHVIQKAIDTKQPRVLVRFAGHLDVFEGRIVREWIQTENDLAVLVVENAPAQAGNVWEWVQDWYEATYYRRSPERNPVNETPGTHRVLRGGGWAFDPAFVRAALRDWLAPGARDVGLGFRCVRAAALPRP